MSRPQSLNTWLILACSWNLLVKKDFLLVSWNYFPANSAGQHCSSLYMYASSVVEAYFRSNKRLNVLFFYFFFRSFYYLGNMQHLINNIYFSNEHPYPPSLQWSISPTFYARLFCTKGFRAAFLYLHCRFKLFRRKEIGAKAARKMLVKLTPNFIYS